MSDYYQTIRLWLKNGKFTTQDFCVDDVDFLEQRDSWIKSHDYHLAWRVIWKNNASRPDVWKPYNPEE